MKIYLHIIGWIAFAVYATVAMRAGSPLYMFSVILLVVWATIIGVLIGLTEK